MGDHNTAGSIFFYYVSFHQVSKWKIACQMELDQDSDWSMKNINCKEAKFKTKITFYLLLPTCEPFSFEQMKVLLNIMKPDEVYLWCPKICLGNLTIMSLSRITFLVTQANKHLQTHTNSQNDKKALIVMCNDKYIRTYVLILWWTVPFTGQNFRIVST